MSENGEGSSLHLGTVEVLVLALSLAMDSFAVTAAAGSAGYAARAIPVLRMAVVFGGFQFLMPLAGSVLGRCFVGLLAPIDHWLAFGLLVLVGGHMLFEKQPAGGVGSRDPTYGIALLGLAVATSLDAMAVGLSFSMIKVAMLIPSLVIGVVTAVVCALGAVLGNWLHGCCSRPATIFGGLLLIGIGVKILLEHTRG